MAKLALFNLPQLPAAVVVRRQQVSQTALFKLLLCFLLSVGRRSADARFFPRPSWRDATAAILSDGITRVKNDRHLTDNGLPGDMLLAEHERRLDEQKHVPRGPITYHNGSILSKTPLNVYLIFYGEWTSDAESVITTFVQSLSDDRVPAPSVSLWWGTALKYHDGKGHVSAEVRGWCDSIGWY